MKPLLIWRCLVKDRKQNWNFLLNILREKRFFRGFSFKMLFLSKGWDHWISFSKYKETAKHNDLDQLGILKRFILIKPPQPHPLLPPPPLTTTPHFLFSLSYIFHNFTLFYDAALEWYRMIVLAKNWFWRPGEFGSHITSL